MSEERKTYEFSFKNEAMHKLEEPGVTQRSIAEKYDIPKSTISKWWREFQQNGEFTDPGNRNDAIPSWSGFNYQGKVMILCVLEKINDLISKGYEDFGQACVELEKLQDFAFKKEGTSMSLWQVKATLSKKTLNSYNDALEKMIDDKKMSGNKTAKCFLISAVEIEDWNNNNIYSSEVALYKYDAAKDGTSKCVGICEVDGFIKQELEITLDYLSVEQKYLEQIYLVICQFIDTKVAEFHDIGRNSPYEINFSEFIDKIKEYNECLINIQELIEKENWYKRISKLIKDNTNNFCRAACNMELKDCSDECGVLRNYQYLQSVDLSKYMKIISPDNNKNDVQYFGLPNTLYEENICEVFKNSAFAAVCNNEGKIFIKVNGGKVELIPTLVEFRRNRRDQEKRISETLRAIETNEFVTSRIQNGVLTAYTDQVVFQTEGDKFTTINLSEIFDENGNIVNKKLNNSQDIMTEKSGFKKFTNTTNNIIVVDCEIVKQYLKEINEDE